MQHVNCCNHKDKPKHTLGLLAFLTCPFNALVNHSSWLAHPYSGFGGPAWITKPLEQVSLSSGAFRQPRLFLLCGGTDRHHDRYEPSATTEKPGSSCRHSSSIHSTLKSGISRRAVEIRGFSPPVRDKSLHSEPWKPLAVQHRNRITALVSVQKSRQCQQRQQRQRCQDQTRFELFSQAEEEAVA